MNKWLIGLVVLAVLIGGYFALNTQKEAPVSGQTIKIGIVTDLTGPASAYWGIPTRLGAELAAKELREQGYAVDLVIEDYQLDAAKAASAVQKLLNLDRVDGFYVDFNPGAIAASSILKGKDILFVYDAAIVSPLLDSPYTFKTYLDYQAGCRAIAQQFKDNGVTKIGMLKMNLEFGQLCLAGVQEVYGENTFVEGYTLGATEFRTSLTKLNAQKVGAIINVGFESEVYNTLKEMGALNIRLPLGTVEDAITVKVQRDFATQLAGARSFGFTGVNPAFSAKLTAENGGKKIDMESGAAVAYTHVKQMVIALDACKKEIVCTTKKVAASPADSAIGFKKFTDRIADLETSLKKY